VIRGDALKALEVGEPGAEETKCIDALLEALDEHIPEPTQDVDKPFLMPVEDVFFITGRGTVVTGLIERGRVRAGDEIEIVGLGVQRTTAVAGVEVTREMLDEGVMGDNAGILLRGTEKDEVEQGVVLAQPGTITLHTKFESHV
jgi:elongation factor Tu